MPISLDFACAQSCCDAVRLSGISARKGCISVATKAGLPEAIPYLQSGHGPAMPALAYMHLQTPARLVETVEAFDLCLAWLVHTRSTLTSVRFALRHSLRSSARPLATLASLSSLRIARSARSPRSRLGWGSSRPSRPLTFDWFG